MAEFSIKLEQFSFLSSDHSKGFKVSPNLQIFFRFLLILIFFINSFGNKSPLAVETTNIKIACTHIAAMCFG